MNATLDVLDLLNVEFNYTKAYAGNECFKRTGTTIPEETINLAHKSDATLFGAVTTVPGQKSAIITLRKELDLYANIRPVKSFKGVKSLYKDTDFVIIRENTEGLYSGVEEYIGEGAIALRIITRKASKRICNFAFQYAEKMDRNRITAVHNAKILKKTDGIFREAFYNIASKYNGLDVEDCYIGEVAMHLLTKPHHFQIMVTTNLLGDILSDEGAGLVGGLGIAPSANIGDNNGLFEPVHGSAPDIAGQGISNPSAMILSAVMMLEYLQEDEEALRLEKALADVLSEGKVLTPDLGGCSKTEDMILEVKKKL